MRKLKKILLLLICVVFIMGEMPVSFAYAQEEMSDELEATQEEKDNEETKEEKEENQNQQEDDEDTGNADADSDKDLDAEPDADEASEKAAEESENLEDLENESEAEEKEDVQQESEAEEVSEEEEAAESIIISFYVPKDAEGEYELLKKTAADEDGKVIFPDADDLPEIEGLYFTGEWQDEEFNSVDEDMIFEESCKLYAVFEEDEPLLSAPIMRAPSIGITSKPVVGQKNVYDCSNSVVTFSIPASGKYRITALGACGGGQNLPADWIDGGYGSMRSGIIKLKKGDVLYLYVGGQGESGARCSHGSPTGNSGGWNGGAKSSYDEKQLGNHGRYWTHGSGGGASDVRFGGTSLSNRIMVAGGGGGANKDTRGYHADGGSYNGSFGTGSEESGGGGYYGGSAHCGGSSYVNTALFTNVQSANGSNTGAGSITLEVVSLFPMITLTKTPAEWTNETVTITAATKSKGEGLPAEYLSWEQDEDGNDIWTDATTYVASQNGTYTCKIRDIAGNIEKASIEITNIDRLLPEGELLPDTVDWTRDDIELTLNADDAAASPEDGKSGLEDKAYLWGAADSDGVLLWELDADGNEAWTDAATYPASQNGTYACQIRDKAGNISEERIKVTNIDRTAPEIKAEHPTWYSGETTVTWQGLDLQPDGSPGSGLHSEAYSFDGVDWTAENTQQITAPGTYTIYVRDAVENMGRYEIELLYDPEPEDDKGGGKGGNNPQPVNPPKQPELPEQPKEDSSGDGGNENLIPQLPLPKEPVKAEIFELAVQEPEVEPELKLPHSPKVKKKKADTMTEIVVDSSYGEGVGHEKLLQAAVMTGVATSGGIILYFALFFIIPVARIYELRGKRRKYLGTKLLLRRKVDLRKLFEKTEESSLMIKINWLYAKYNAGKKLSCIKGQDIEEKDVQATMIVYR
jgi:hypothetical protein